jgi:tryptophan-rich sensory protein
MELDIARPRRLLPDAIAFGAPLAVGAVGGVATAPQIATWYRTLAKPTWNPPDAVFGPVWTTLYLLMGLALVLARRADQQRSGRLEAIFGLQLALNLAWSLVFFGRRDIQGGLVVIVLLWAAIVGTIIAFAKARPLSAALLLPYLGWVTFAAVLNAEVSRLNP